MSLLWPSWTRSRSESIRPDPVCASRSQVDCQIHLERWGIRQRNTYLKEIDQVFRNIAKNPMMGRECAEVREGYRKFPHGGHMIYYKQSGKDLLLVVRILHVAMDVDVQIR